MPTTDQLQDTVITLEALVTDMLAERHGKESAKKIVADYKLKHNQAAIKEREKKEEAARVSRAIGRAKRAFTDHVRANYWKLEVLSEKQRKEYIADLWKSLTEEHDIPQSYKAPEYTHQQANFEKLAARKAELEGIIARANMAQAEDTVRFAENAKASFKKSMEDKLRIRLMELKRMTGISDGDREKLIASAKQDCKLAIERNNAQQDKDISSSKLTFARVDDAKRELTKLKTLITKAM